MKPEAPASGRVPLSLSLYLDFDGSGQARDLVMASKVRRHWPLPVPPLLLFAYFRRTKVRKLAHLVGLQTD